MIEKLFNYSRLNSSFKIYSQRGDENTLKQGQGNRYYRMRTSDKSFRVGYQQYDGDKELFLSIAIGSDRFIPDVEFAMSAISALSQKKMQSCKSRTGEVIYKSWEFGMGSGSLEGLFSLQEILLSFFETKI